VRRYYQMGTHTCSLTAIIISKLRRPYGQEIVPTPSTRCFPALLRIKSRKSIPGLPLTPRCTAYPEQSPISTTSCTKVTKTRRSPRMLLSWPLSRLCCLAESLGLLTRTPPISLLLHFEIASQSQQQDDFGNFDIPAAEAFFV
jgi:hypothetical protein